MMLLPLLLLNALLAQAITFNPLNTVPGTNTLENLAIRHTGDLLVTSVTSRKLHQISRNSSIPPVVIADIEDTLALLGITELEQDVFYVAGSNLTGSTAAPNSNRVWKVDMRGAGGEAKIDVVARFPNATLLNGMTRLDDNHVLIADSAAGSITKLDVRTGNHSIVIRDSTFAPLDSGNGVGVNGIHTHGEYLYYTSLDQNIFGRVPIDMRTGVALGPIEIIARGILFQDDFALSRDGKKAYVSQNGEYTVTEVDIQEKTFRVLANSTNLQAALSVALGKECDGEVAMFVTGSKNVTANETVGSVSEGMLLL